MKIRNFPLNAVFILLTFLVTAGYCKKGNAPHQDAKLIQHIQISDSGKKISFPHNYPGLKRFEFQIAGKGEGFLSVLAPAKVIATISSADKGRAPVTLFESGEITSIYFRYRKNQNDLFKATQNLERIRDMFQNQVATRREVIEAQTDFQNAQAELSESEGQLRALGLEPKEFEGVRSDSVFLICDVPETQLQEVEKGERVDIRFASFPGEKYEGVADAVGDNIDPSTRTMKIRVLMPNLKHRFRPGMFAQVEFGDRRTNIMLLPQSAIVTVDGVDYAFVLKSEYEFERREVALGTASQGNVLVRSGIQNGDKVAVKGVMLLKGLSFGY